MLFPTWGQAVYPLWWPRLMTDMQTEQLLYWSGMIDTEHTTSSKNETLLNRVRRFTMIFSALWFEQAVNQLEKSKIQLKTWKMVTSGCKFV